MSPIPRRNGRLVFYHSCRGRLNGTVLTEQNALLLAYSINQSISTTGLTELDCDQNWDNGDLLFHQKIFKQREDFGQQKISKILIFPMFSKGYLLLSRFYQYCCCFLFSNSIPCCQGQPLPSQVAEAGFELLTFLLPSLKCWYYIQPMSVDNIHYMYLLQLGLKCLFRTMFESLIARMALQEGFKGNGTFMKQGLVGGSQVTGGLSIKGPWAPSLPCLLPRYLQTSSFVPAQ